MCTCRWQTNYYKTLLVKIFSQDIASGRNNTAPCFFHQNLEMKMWFESFETLEIWYLPDIYEEVL